MRNLSLFFILWLVSMAAFASNSGVTYQGRILKPDGTALSGTNVQFKLQIRTPDAAGCLMYEELQALNMSQSNGSFSLTINDSTGSRTDTTGLTLDRIFANRGSFTLDVSTCTTGTGVWAPNSSDGRNLVVLFKDETMAAWEPIPAQKINFVPYAFESKQVGGFTADSLLRVVAASGDPLTGLSPLSNAQYTELLALVGGTSTQYSKTAQLGGASLPTLASLAQGQVLSWDTGTSKWVATTVVGGASSVSQTMIQNGAVSTSQVAGDVTINTTGTLGAAFVTARDFKIYSASPGTGFVEMKSVVPNGSSTVLTWPAAYGSAGQVLTTDAAGVLSWAAPATSSQWTDHAPNISYDGGGNVGIGTTSPSAKLDLVGNVSLAATYTNETGNQMGLFQKTTVTPTANTAIGGYSEWTDLSLSGTVNYSGSSYGALHRALNFSTGSVASLAGTKGQLENRSSGTVTNAYGTVGTVANTSTGTMSNAFGLYSQVLNSAGGTIGKGYGVYVETAPSTGTVSDYYALYAVNGKSYFGGNVGIGTTSPAQKLEVSGLITGGSYASVHRNTLDLSADNGSVSAVDYNFPSGRFRAAMGNIKGTNDIFFQALPATTSGYGFLEAWQAAGLVLGTGGNTNPVIFQTNRVEQMRITGSGNVGIGTTSPTARLQVKAGTTAAGTAPLKFTSGPLMTASEDGAMEYDGTGLWFTIGSTRYVIPTNSSAGNYSGVSSIGNASGSITMTPMAGNSVIINQSTVSTSSSTGALIVNGGVGIAGAVNADGNITSGGSVTATTSMYTPQIYGGTGAGANIQIDGADNATKGNVYLASQGGFVGVGTTSPQQVFDVNGTALFRSILYGPNGFYVNNSNTAALPVYAFNNGTPRDTGMFSPSAHVIGFTTSGAERMRIDTAGNVGIGTTSPLRPFHIASATTATMILEDTANGTDLKKRFISTGTAGELNFGKFSDSMAATFNMVLDTNGNLGLGTTSPGVQFDQYASQPLYRMRASGLAHGVTILSDTTDTAMSMASGAGSAGGFSMYTYSGSSTQNAYSLTAVQNAPAAATAAMSFYADKKAGSNATALGTSDKVFEVGTFATPLFEILGGGNVGIGTAAPSTTLAFDGTAARTIGMERATVNASDGFSLTVNAGGVKSSAVDHNGGNLILASGISSGTGSSGILFQTTTPTTTGSTNTSPTTKMTILGNGNVGIGTTSPSYPLDVVGRMQQTLDSGTSAYSATSLNATGLLLNAYLSGGTTNGAVSSINFRAAYGSSPSFNAKGAINLIQPNYSSHASDMSIQLRDGSGNIGEIMRMQSSGNVGIGTTAPLGPLDVYRAGDTGDSSIYIRSGTSSTSTARAMIKAREIGGGAFDYGSDFGYNNDNAVDAFQLQMINGGTPTTVMTIPRSTGNVGIGTTAPAATLDVNGFAKLKMNSSAPVTCTATNYGSLAMTSTGTLCSCVAAGWMQTASIASACVW